MPKKFFSYENHKKIAFYVSSIISMIYFVNSEYFDITIDYFQNKIQKIEKYFEDNKNPDFFNPPIDENDVESF